MVGKVKFLLQISRGKSCGRDRQGVILLNAEIVVLVARMVGARDGAPGLPFPSHYFEFPCGRSRVEA